MLLPNPARERFSIVETREGFVTGFGGMPTPAQASDNAGDNLSSSDASSDEAPLMFTGIQILEPRIFDFIPRGVFSHSVTDVYLPAIAKGERIAAHVAAGMWHELSTIPRYLEINLALMEAVGRSVELGANSYVSPEAHVRQAILWDDVTVEAGARVFRAILGDGVRIRSGERIENAAVVRAELVRGMTPPPKALAGAMSGENFVVPLSG